MNASKVITCRRWTEPAIKAYVSHGEIGAEMDLNVFLETLVEEVGNPTFMVTKASLTAKLQEAARLVLEEMRKTTAHVA